MITITGNILIFIGATVVVYNTFFERILSMPETLIIIFLGWLMTDRIEEKNK